MNNLCSNFDEREMDRILGLIAESRNTIKRVVDDILYKKQSNSPYFVAPILEELRAAEERLTYILLHHAYSRLNSGETKKEAAPQTVCPKCGLYINTKASLYSCTCPVP